MRRHEKGPRPLGESTIDCATTGLTRQTERTRDTDSKLRRSSPGHDRWCDEKVGRGRLERPSPRKLELGIRANQGTLSGVKFEPGALLADGDRGSR